MSNADKSGIAWQITTVLYGCLLLALILDHTLLRQAFYWPVYLMQTIPLLMVLPGLWQRQPRSVIWLCFIILFHFLVAVENIFQSFSAGNVYIAAYTCMIAIILSLFTSSILFVRWQKQS